MKNGDLLKFRQAFCMNQKCMAYLLDVSRGHYSKLENGKRKICTDVENRFNDLKKSSKRVKKHLKGIKAYLELSFELDNQHYPTILQRIKNFFKGFEDD